MRKKTGLLILLLLPTLLFAQKETETDTVIAGKIGWMAYPYAFYTPETQLAIGAGALVYFRTTTKEPVRPSKILLSGYYTTNNQYYIKLTPVIYFPGMDQDIIDLKFIYSKEIGKFYGVGQSTPEFENPEYTMKTWRAYIEYSGFTFVSSSFHTGLIYEYSPNNVTDKQQNKFLINDIYTGSSGGTVAGLGLLMIFDKRDNIFFPTNNHFYKIRAQFFGRYFGGDFEYNRTTVICDSIFQPKRDIFLPSRHTVNCTVQRSALFPVSRAWWGSENARLFFTADSGISAISWPRPNIEKLSGGGWVLPHLLVWAMWLVVLRSLIPAHSNIPMGRDYALYLTKNKKLIFVLTSDLEKIQMVFISLWKRLSNRK